VSVVVDVTVANRRERPPEMEGVFRIPACNRSIRWGEIEERKRARSRRQVQILRLNNLPRDGGSQSV
jgi:hypothetical protein